MAESFEDRMERACKDKEIPGAVLFSSNKDGRMISLPAN